MARLRLSDRIRSLLRLHSDRNTAPKEDGYWDRRQFLAVTTVAAVAAARMQGQTRRAKGPVPPERVRYQVHPAVGVARLGNSPDSFYLEPESIGGLPIECDAGGNAKGELVKQFKHNGRIRRQAARFRIYAFDSADPDDPGREVTLHDADVERIEWTVHLANTKASWYNNDEFVGDVMLATPGNDNYYPSGTQRNWDFYTTDADRQKYLIIDPGPRSVAAPGERKSFSKATGLDYPFHSFPPLLPVDEPNPPRAPYDIDTLGDLMMDADGRAIVLGGFGRAGGQESIATYTGQDTWFDDISDGPVRCRLYLKGRKDPIEMTAWALVGSPKYAPELVNIVTLDDVMFDVGVRYMNMVPDLYRNGSFNTSYLANYERDIQPIIERPADYVWVANLPSMVPFTALRFDPRDASEANRKNRETYFGYYRDPGANELAASHQDLHPPNGARVPAMPLNSGSNSVTNQNIDKFMALTNTQYFLLRQWAAGKFTVGRPARQPKGVHPLDQVSVGNCVGHPQSPGIEVTWTTRNPSIYDTPFRIKQYKDEAYYAQHGISPSRDETVDTTGCQPGDLTKRMSPPWMSDFYQCSVEYINFRNPNMNETLLTGIPPAPTYYAYWWPPQAPMYVITGEMTRKDQGLAGIPAGYSVYYTRGANNIGNLVLAWAYTGFILNDNDRAEGRQYPYFVEKERNHDKFVASAVAVGHPVNQLAAQGSYATADNYFVPMWYLREEGEVAECDGIPDCKHPE